MDVTSPMALLGGLSAQAFMRRHWQKRPLLVRQALPGVMPPLPRAALFDLAGRDGVESRLVQRRDGHWRLRHGPLPRRALPPLRRREWTLLVQGLDLHVPAARALLESFRFIPDARLDDVMLSWASDGGGVGPHLDSYDVFLVQVQGRRRWRVGRIARGADAFVEGLPLRVLRHFEPEHEWLLEPGDMLYLPPRWGHDGVAEGECMTASVGFRAPSREGLARELLQRLADDMPGDERLYADPRQGATATPGALPPALLAFAQQSLQRVLCDPQALPRALGALLSEPKPTVWFEHRGARRPGQGVALDAGSRMLYDERHVFLNGEAFVAAGRDARLMRRLADTRRLGAADCSALGGGAQALLDDWLEHGWLHGSDA